MILGFENVVGVSKLLGTQLLVISTLFEAFSILPECLLPQRTWLRLRILAVVTLHLIRWLLGIAMQRNIVQQMPHKILITFSTSQRGTMRSLYFRMFLSKSDFFSVAEVQNRYKMNCFALCLCFLKNFSLGMLTKLAIFEICPIPCPLPPSLPDLSLLLE